MQILTKESYLPYEERMEKTVHVLHESFNSIRAGRANPHVLDKIAVAYYGTNTPIQQVANIQVPEPRMITITPWDPSILKEVERAIQASDLGINPNNDGKMIRLVFPVLTEDRRKELAKQVAKYGEEAKVSVRNIRRDGIDKYRSLHKNKEVTDDTLAEFEEEMQKLTDRYVKEVEQIMQDKEKDLLEL